MQTILNLYTQRTCDFWLYAAFAWLAGVVALAFAV